MSVAMISSPDGFADGVGLVRSDSDRALAFRQAARHSRFVRVMRKGLPAVALAMLALYFVSSRLSFSFGGLEASVGSIELNRDSLRMVNPKLEGADKKKGSYVITADFAEQNVKTPSLIELNAIKAELNSPTKGWSRLSAEKGKYDTKSEQLVIENDIRIATSSGMSGLLQHAAIDMKAQTLKSDAPVAFDLVNGTVRAAGMELQSSERILTFRGNVRVHIKKLPDKGRPKPGGEAATAAREEPAAAVGDGAQAANPGEPAHQADGPRK